MGERSLRGSRLGSVSYETERNTAPIDRQYAEYRCASGHLFTVPFADDAELPDTWECKFDGSAAKLVGGAEPAPKKVKPPRTHRGRSASGRDQTRGLPSVSRSTSPSITITSRGSVTGAPTGAVRVLRTCT